MDHFKQRRARLRGLLGRVSADAMLICGVANVRYLTGFTGDDSLLLVTAEGEAMLSDPRFEQQIAEECPGLDAWIREAGSQLLAFTSECLRGLGLGRLVLETHIMSVADYDFLDQQRVAGELDKASVQVEQLREIKDATEVATLRKAVAMAERVFVGLRAQLTARQTERDVASWIEYQLRCQGADGCSFPPIVAVGPRAALPHARPGQSTIGSAPFVLIDWGAKFEGYCSDLTRVLVTSKIPAKFSRAYDLVCAAQAAAIAALRPGISVGDVDQVAREIIASAGMGKRFSHGLGHGIGLEIHEAPRVGRRTVPSAQRLSMVRAAASKSSTEFARVTGSSRPARQPAAGADSRATAHPERVLQAGMVITIEPGVYFPEWGGIRIEDDVLITPTGCEVLSSLPREMEANQVALLA